MFIKDNTKFEFIYLTRQSRFITLDKETFDAVRLGHFNSLSLETIEHLKKIGLVTDSLNELLDLIQENKTERDNKNDSFFIAIQPTNACQMACTYCGQGHGKDIYGEADILKLVNFIEDQVNIKNYKKVEVGLFGAESLIATSQILSFFSQLSKRLNNKVCLTSTLVTNGLLLKHETLAKLKKIAGLKKVEITIDGSKEFHDKRRVLKDGSPTFDKILSGIESVCHLFDDSMELSIRTNIDESNIESVDGFIETILSKSWINKATVYFAPVHSWGNDAHKFIMNRESFGQKYFQLKKKLINKKIKTHALLPKRMHSTCMATNEHSILVDPYLNIFSCTEVSIVPAYENSKHKTFSGNLKTTYNRNDYTSFYDEVLNNKWPCANCPLFPVCAGACPKIWEEGLNACPTEKYIIPDILDYIIESTLGELHAK